jgi:hypothetical protein
MTLHRTAVLPMIGPWTATGPIEFRSTIQAGISVLNFDMVGADSGSVGPFVATTPIGLGVRATRWLRLVLDPGGVAFSIPQTEGIPLIVRQHRLSLGLQLTP